MQSAPYYREQAARARRLAAAILEDDACAVLERMAVDFDHIAEDLERGAIEITHPSLLPQQQERERAQRG